MSSYSSIQFTVKSTDLACFRMPVVLKDVVDLSISLSLSHTHTGLCRFAHTLPECIANPEKYTRYEISWDDEEDKGLLICSRVE